MSIFLGHRKSIQLANQKIPDVTKFLKNDGSDNMLGNLDLGNYAINNLKTYPSSNKNATSKKYVDDETAKLLDLDANRQMKGDLDMNDNSIIGIHDISANNSCPTKKYVKDELAKKGEKTKVSTNETNISQNSTQLSLNSSKIITNTNDLTILKARPLFSHYSFFLFSNPIQGVYKEPFPSPAVYPDQEFFLSDEYNDKTKINILGIVCDSDSTLPTTNLLLSIEAIMFSKTGGFNSKVFVSGKNMAPYKYSGSNKLNFDDDLSFVIKDFHSSWNSWKSFKLKIAVPWSGNETRLTFSVTYY